MITREQLDICQRYLDCRQNGDIEGCLELMSDQIILTSEKDGTFRGRTEMRRYLQSNPYQGTWGRPYWSEADRSIRVDGKARVYLVSFKVKILTRIGDRGLIESVYVGRR
jgi:hypothetical protein